MPLPSKASNAVLAKARALYGRRLVQQDYARLAACRTMTELAAALKALPLYAPALAGVNPVFAHRTQLEAQLRQSIFDRYDSLCRFDMSAGDSVYRYFSLSCEVDEIMTCLRCIDSGSPDEYLFKLPDFLQQRTVVDLYKLAHATDLPGLMHALAGTPYAKLLAPLLRPSAETARGLLVQAEPLLQDYRHKALVALAPGTQASAYRAQPGVRQYIELECDVAALSNAARLIRMHAPVQTVSAAARRDCTALSAAQWQDLLASRDVPAFKQVLGNTPYGPQLAKYQYGVLKEGLQKYQYDWCRKWLRFSTDPTLVMLCYVFLARSEVVNLNHIIEGIHYAMPADAILPLLVGCEQTEGSVN